MYRQISVSQYLGKGEGALRYIYLWGPKYSKWFSNLNIKSVKPQCLHRFDLTIFDYVSILHTRIWYQAVPIQIEPSPCSHWLS